MKISQILSKICSKYNLSTSEACEILSHVLGEAPKVFLSENREVDLKKLWRFKKALRKIKNGAPLARITKKVNFMGMDITVDEGVFIPRSDTENLVDLILKEKPKSVLEIGTGTGCIALALAKAGVKVIATEIDKRAFKNSLKNFARHNAKIEIYNTGTIFSTRWLGIKAVASNPPYVKQKDLGPLLKWEPKIALDGGVNGTGFYRKIFAESNKFLPVGGRIFLECGYDVWQRVLNLALKYGYRCRKICGEPARAKFIELVRERI